MIEGACEQHKPDLAANPCLDDVLAVDQWARQAVREQVNRGTKRMASASLAA